MGRIILMTAHTRKYLYTIQTSGSLSSTGMLLTYQELLLKHNQWNRC
jgi:hypothetical protein